MSTLEHRRFQQITFDSKPLHIINLYSYAFIYNWIEPELEKAGISHSSFRLCRVGRHLSFWHSAKISWRAIRAAKKRNAVLVTHNPPATDSAGMLMRLPWLRVPHIAYTWHYPYPPSKTQRLKSLVSKPAVDAFIVHCEKEVERGCERFNLKPEQIYAAYWAYENNPDIEQTQRLFEGDYICTIGGSDRDYASTLKVMKGLPNVKMILVCRPDNIENLDVPDNVTVCTGISLADCWNIIRHCKLFLLPLASEDSHCGHSVLVQAMREKKPCVVSDAASMQGYVEKDVTAKIVPVGDVAAMQTEIRTLLSNPDDATALGERANEFAEKHFSQTAVAKSFLSAIGYDPSKH